MVAAGVPGEVEVRNTYSRMNMLSLYEDSGFKLGRNVSSVQIKKIMGQHICK